MTLAPASPEPTAPNQSSAPVLRKTPLHPRHLALGAKMMAFAGWDMPVEYGGLASEHQAVRTRAGLFDVSHMGEIEIAGPNALGALQRLVCSDPERLDVGQAQYAGLLTPEGTFIDDLIVYRMAQTHFLLVVNASNTARDFAWISEHVKRAGDAAAIDSSARYALLALHGPAAQNVLQPLATIDLSEIGSFRFAHGEVANARVTIARTGYTGEDGFEIFVPPAMAERVWQAILQSGAESGVVPVGLGARDTLRLEAGLRLHGNDIDDTTTVLEAGLGWIIGWTNEAFIGRERLLEQRAGGLTRRLIGFELLDRGIARHGHRVMQDGAAVGVVTSGTQTPTVGKAIGMAYVPIEKAQPGTDIDIEIRGRLVKARVVRMPFYKRVS